MTENMFRYEINYAIRAGFCDKIQVWKFIKLMDKHSIPKRKILSLIYSNQITISNLVDFVIHMDFVRWICRVKTYEMVFDGICRVEK